jgi:hypothetical protein
MVGPGRRLSLILKADGRWFGPYGDGEGAAALGLCAGAVVFGAAAVTVLVPHPAAASVASTPAAAIMAFLFMLTPIREASTAAPPAAEAEATASRPISPRAGGWDKGYQRRS